jgi:hypothetical protein
MNENEKMQAIASARIHFNYTEEVKRWEPVFFEPVAVQLRDGYSPVEHRGRRVGRHLRAEHAVNVEGLRLDFEFCIPCCMISPSEIAGRLALVVNPDGEDDAPVKIIDIDPSQIVYVTLLRQPGAEVGNKPNISLVS